MIRQRMNETVVGGRSGAEATVESLRSISALSAVSAVNE
jgi:hypothetical protein